MRADMLVDPKVPAAAEQELVSALAAVGVIAHPRVLPVRRGPESIGWLILLAVPLQAFLSTVGERAASDAWTGVRRAVRRVTGHAADDPAGQGRPVVLEDPGTGLQIVVSPDLPEGAFRQLTELDLSDFVDGPVRYDNGQHRWLSDRDEARRK
jgi:hypothetical protein